MDHKKIKIVLCEDEEFVARSYIRKLEHEGYEVSHASNGKIGLEKILNEHPDIVLLDLMMPVKDGFKVLTELQGNDDKSVQNIPVIVTSNLGQDSDIDEAMRLGAVDFLVKSNISLKELMAKIEEHLPQQK